jgi:hypothetical protein
MRPFSTSIALAAILLGLAITPALRAQVDVSTGLSANGHLITNDGQFDAHWLVQQMSGQYTPAQVVMPGDPDGAFFAWQANGPNSDWIARDAFNCCNGPGPYSFTTTFYLSSVAGFHSFTGAWAVDDVGSLYLNNCLIVNHGTSYHLLPFSVTNPACFRVGVNTITFTMDSDDNRWEAVRLEGTVRGEDDLVPQCVLPPNTTMVAWYPFDELTGTTSANLATGNAGTHPNGLGITSGKVGKAASFNGNQWVESPSSIATNFGPGQTAAACSTGSSDREGDYSSCRGNFSIDTWVQVNDFSGVMTIVDKREGAQPAIYGYGFFLHSNNTMSLQLADGVGTLGYTDYFSPTLLSLTDGAWHHIAVTVDRRLTPTGITWYYDSTAIGNSDPTDRRGFLVNRVPLRIGTATTGLSNWFKGNLDELEIYNRVLTADEVLGIVNADSSGKCKPPPLPPPPPCANCEK